MYRQDISCLYNLTPKVFQTLSVFFVSNILVVIYAFKPAQDSWF